MNEAIIEDAKEFLISYLKGKSIGYETIHPWHREWKCTILHSLRVEEYAKQIIESDCSKISKNDALIIRLAAILHDIGRYDNRKEHAQVGQKIVNDWIDTIKDQGIDSTDKNLLLGLIIDHCKKDGRETHYVKAVLQDADALDEIGMMSIFMAGNQIDREDAFYFNRLLERIKGFEIDFCNKVFGNLNTEPGKQIMKKKYEFIKDVIKQLEMEIVGTNLFDNGILEKLSGA